MLSYQLKQKENKATTINMTITPLRIVFMGTPEFAVASLDALVKAGYNIVGVITAPDKAAGRGMQLQQSAVKKYAVEQNLKVLQPEKHETICDPACGTAGFLISSYKHILKANTRHTPNPSQEGNRKSPLLGGDLRGGLTVMIL